MAAELSELEAGYTHTPAEGRAPAVSYRISAADTTPKAGYSNGSPVKAAIPNS